MPDEPKVGDSTVVEDVLLTDAFLVKGRVEGKFSRLFKVLDTYERDFLVISDATMVDIARGEVIRTPRVHVNMDELLLAHELVDGAGDFFQKTLSSDTADEKSVRIRAFYNGSVSLELAGRIRPRAYEGAAERRFFVMEDCAVRGIDMSLSRELEIVSSLPYAIVNRRRIAYLYDFSEHTG